MRVIMCKLSLFSADFSLLPFEVWNTCGCVLVLVHANTAYALPCGRSYVFFRTSTYHTSSLHIEKRAIDGIVSVMIQA
jgi:hypothetical protein